MALFVGLLVVGQTVYSSTLEHLRQFGTLKAIGASNTFVVRVVLQQALLAGLLGFL
ncbi:FtsX-like permease family protein, partial [Escherichia coli]|uniref:FtsX-like permease family protein n=1 Tax=Escherichia coli TaxID=562 RepID=UPI00396582E4